MLPQNPLLAHYSVLTKQHKEQLHLHAGENAAVIVDEDLTDLGAINPAFAAIAKIQTSNRRRFIGA